MYNFSYLQIRQLLWEEGTIIFTGSILVFLSCQGILIHYVTQNRFPKNLSEIWILMVKQESGTGIKI